MESSENYYLFLRGIWTNRINLGKNCLCAGGGFRLGEFVDLEFRILVEKVRVFLMCPRL